MPQFVPEPVHYIPGGRRRGFSHEILLKRKGQTRISEYLVIYAECNGVGFCVFFFFSLFILFGGFKNFHILLLLHIRTGVLGTCMCVPLAIAGLKPYGSRCSVAMDWRRTTSSGSNVQSQGECGRGGRRRVRVRWNSREREHFPFYFHFPGFYFSAALILHTLTEKIYMWILWVCDTKIDFSVVIDEHT